MDDHYSLLMESAKTEADRHNVGQAWEYAKEWAQTELSILASKHLLRRANRWGIDIPVDAWVETENRGSYVAVTAQSRIKRQIICEAFAYWEGWVKIIVPVLSLLVALAAIYFR